MTDPLALINMLFAEPTGDAPIAPLPAESLMPGESAGIPTESPLYAQVFGRPRLPGQTPPLIPRSAPRAPRIPATRIPRAQIRVSGGFGNLGFADLLFLSFHPQALGLLQAIQGMKQAESDREFQQQQYERSNRAQDLQTQLQLNQMGGTEITPGVEKVTGALNEAFGPSQHPRMQVTAPSGQRFYVPTAQEQQQKAYEAYRAQEEIKAQAAARLALIRATATAQARAAAEPRVPIAPDFARFFHLGEVDSMPRSAVDAMVRQYNAVKPKDTVRIITNNDGTLSIARAGASGTTVEKVLGGPTKTTAEGGLTPYQESQKARADRKEIGKVLSDAQGFIDKARQVDSADKPQDPRTGAEWQAARIATQQAAQQYPDQFEVGEDANGYPYIKLKPGATGTTPGTARTRGISNVPALTKAAQVGGIYMHKGEKVRVVSIDPQTGEIQLERVQ